MARKGRHRRGGRVTPKGTRPLGFRLRPPDDSGGYEPEPDLLGDVRRALADDHPLALLTLASSLLTLVDPRRTSPFERGRGRSTPTRDELVRSFTEIDRRETSALLAGIAALSPDEVERRRLTRVIEGRDHPPPAWLAAVARAEAYRTTEMTHVLGDGDNVMVGVRLPTGAELTAVAYVDHNLGTLVKDAFVVPGPIGELVELLAAEAGNQDTTFDEIPPADAKARVVEAIELGAITFPPLETDTWPACRPLLEWVVGLLPDGGRGYERPEWSTADRRLLAKRFFASPFAAGLAERDHRDLLDTIVSLGCDYSPGDPMRWSPVAVEILLTDRIPRKVMADVAYLAKAPDLLRGFVPFCHAERGVPAHLTAETLAALDDCEPQYQATIRSPRLQGPAALLAAAGALGPGSLWDLDDDDEDDDLWLLDDEDEDDEDDDLWDLEAGDYDPWDYETLIVDALQLAVGGREALAALDDGPLPDEPFDWTGVPADVHARVAEVLALCDRCCEALLDVEHRTAARRVLARIAGRGPHVFRRRGRAETAAAAVCWAVGKANEAFDQRRGGLTQKALLAHFGLQGSISDRAATLLEAGGFPRHWSGDVALGSPDCLVSGRRRTIIERYRRLPIADR